MNCRKAISGVWIVYDSDIAFSGNLTYIKAMKKCKNVKHMKGDENGNNI